MVDPENCMESIGSDLLTTRQELNNVSVDELLLQHFFLKLKASTKGNTNITYTRKEDEVGTVYIKVERTIS